MAYPSHRRAPATPRVFAFPAVCRYLLPDARGTLRIPHQRHRLLAHTPHLTPSDATPRPPSILGLEDSPQPSAMRLAAFRPLVHPGRSGAILGPGAGLHAGLKKSVRPSLWNSMNSPSVKSASKSAATCFWRTRQRSRFDVVLFVVVLFVLPIGVVYQFVQWLRSAVFTFFFGA